MLTFGHSKSQPQFKQISEINELNIKKKAKLDWVTFGKEPTPLMTSAWALTQINRL